MAGPTISTKIKLDGEREYKAALSEINSGLKVLASEMGLASEEFADNSRSVEALTKKHDVLERTISTQKEKVEVLRKAMENSAQEYGEASTKTNKWKEQLNKAETELLKMEKAADQSSQSINKMSSPLDKVRKALSDAKEQGTGFRGILGNLKEQFSGSAGSANGLGSALQDVAGKFGIELPGGASKALEALNGVNAGAATAAAGLGLVVAAVVKAEKALIDITKESAAAADEIITLSSTTGLATQTIQEMQYAADFVDVSLDTITGSMTKLTAAMGKANDGNDAASQKFQELGVNIYNADGSLRRAEDVFYDTVDALGRISNETERDATAMELLGKSATDLNPLIQQGSKRLKELGQEAHDMGYVLDNEALNALGAVDDGMQRMKKTQEGVTNQIAAEFAPYMADALEKTANFIKKIGKAFKDSGIVSDFGSILKSASSLLEPIGELAGVVLPALEKVLNPIAKVMALIADTANLLVGLVTLNGDKIKTALGWNAKYGQLSNYQQAVMAGKPQAKTIVGGYIEAGTGKYVTEYSDGTVSRNAHGTNFWRGGTTLVGENGPELVTLPRGSSITTASETRSLVGDVFNITIDARSVQEFQDIIEMARNARRLQRMEGMA